MVWTVVNIAEDDFGCEERMPGEPLIVLVTLESEDGRRCQFGVADQWLYLQEINEGDEWPEDLDEIDSEMDSSIKQAEWMENYLEAIEEL